MIGVEITSNCSICENPLQADYRSSNQYSNFTYDFTFKSHLFFQLLHLRGILTWQTVIQLNLCSTTPSMNSLRNLTFLIITADSDFTNTIRGLVRTKCNVMGCIDHKSTNMQCNSKKNTQLQGMLILGSECMIQIATTNVALNVILNIAPWVIHSRPSINLS